jgi:hypothetical protein
MEQEQSQLCKCWQFPRWTLILFAVLAMVFLASLSAEKIYDFTKKIIGQKPDNTISMSAEGKVTAVPDLATAQIGVLAEAKTAVIAQDESTKKVNEIIRTTIANGIPKEDITTSSFNMYPKYDYKDGRSDIVGYVVNQTVSIKVRGVDKNPERIGKILEDATSNGANQMQGVAFGFDDPDNLRQEARKLAIEKAKVKAQELAEVAGISLGRVVSISESSGSGYPIPYPADYRNLSFSKAAEDQALVAPDIQPGTTDIVQNITVIFEVK